MVINGDTRSLDYSSYGGLWGVGLPRIAAPSGESL